MTVGRRGHLFKLACTAVLVAAALPLASAHAVPGELDTGAAAGSDPITGADAGADAGAANPDAQADALDDGTPERSVPTRRLVVRVEPGTEATVAPMVAAELGATDVDALAPGTLAVETGALTDADSAESTLERSPVSSSLRDVGLDGPIETDLVPDDPMFWDEWGHFDINTPATWDTTQGSNTIVVAVPDTGIDITHPDLAANIWTNTAETPGNGVDDDANGRIDDVHGWDFLNDDATVFDSADDDSHGTHVAGTIAAATNNGIGVSGVAWNVKIMPLKFIGPSGGYTSDAVEALKYARDMGADIINMSWGGTLASSELSTAIDSAGASGIASVAAAGNEGQNIDASPHYPASYASESIIAVAAVDSAGRLAGFSNTGRGGIDIGAPGVSVLSTVPGGYQYWSGTSMAAPHVTGALALLESQYPQLNLPELKHDILVSATPTPSLVGKTVTGGRLQLRNALSYANFGAYNKGFTGGVFNASGRFTNPGSVGFVTGPDAGGGPHLRTFTADGTISGEFLAYGGTFWGGVRVAAGDIDGDGKDEIIAAPGPGGGPNVKAYEINGVERKSWMAYGAFTGGVYVASADVVAGGNDEVVTAPGAGGGPHVRVWDSNGNPLKDWMAYGAFTGGVRVAAGDLTGGPDAEIVTAPGPGGGPHIRIWDRNGNLLEEWMAYGAFTGGVYVATSRLSDGTPVVVTGAGEGGGPHVKVWRYDGTLASEFMLSNPFGATGVRVSSDDFVAGGQRELLMTLGPGQRPYVVINKQDGNQVLGLP